MDKPIRKAVRCYLIKDNQVMVTKYKQGTPKEGYYDIPGGKIEEQETVEQTAMREMKEETGVKVSNLRNKGNMLVEYPNRKYDFTIFVTNEYEGEPQEFEENTSEWIKIDDLLQKEKILSNIIILDRFYKKALLDDKYCFNMHIVVDEEENILKIEYCLEEE